MRPSHRDLLACAVLLLVACGGPQDRAGEGGEPGDRAAPEPRQERAGPRERGDWLVLWLLADPEKLNPLTSNDSASNSVLGWIFSGLLTTDNETLELRPLIAAAMPEVSEDKLTYTFRLRDDVTFSDGTPLTAHDLVFTMKAIKNPRVDAAPSRNYYESVRDAVAVDDHTVRFDLKQLYFRNTIVLGSLQPMPRHYYDPEDLLEGISVDGLDSFDTLGQAEKERAAAFAKAFNEDFLNNPMGPGPFVLRDPDKDYSTGERIVLHHRGDYWAPDDPRLEDSFFDRILFRIVNDREAALVALKRGELDVMGLTPLQDKVNKNNARFHEKVATEQHFSPGYSYIGWNQEKRVFQDRRVRQALSHFVDKRNLVDKVLLGLGVSIESPIYFERPEYNQQLEPYAFDPERGKALLTEAGWTDSDGDGVREKNFDGERVPLRFEIISNSGNDIRRDIALTVVDEMKKAGIDASFRSLDWTIMLDKVRKHDYEAVILGWGMSVLVPDLYQVWHSSQSVLGGSNYISFKNDEADEILEKYRLEFDPAERKLLYDRLQRILYDEQPYTFIFTQKGITAWDRRFEGVRWYRTGGSDLHEWWVPRELQRHG